MNYSVGEHYDQFIQQQVAAGRFSSAAEVIRAGLHLMEQREAKIAWLRNHLQEAIEEEGSYSSEELSKMIETGQWPD